jgi:hypothetical protein
MKYLWLNIGLPNTGNCEIIGLDSDGTQYVEEFYDEEWLAQHIISPDGSIIETRDEGFGHRVIQPITIPRDAKIADFTSNFRGLTYDTGAPLTGNGADDHIHALVYPIAMPDRIRLADALKLNAPPFSIIGLSLSRVTWVSPLPDEQWLVCRTLGIAHTLMDSPTDYATEICYLLQQRSTSDDLLNVDTLPITGLNRPQQAVWRDGKLYIADSGGPDQPNRILIYSNDP